MRFFSPAKVNLFLKVPKRRDDGYHDISSLFQAITLGDWIDFEISGSDALSSDLATLACDSSNLVDRARRFFREKTGCEARFKIHIEKRIPIGGGLGGGSSNGATTLFALNALTGSQIPSEVLRGWSSELGSDMPFFFSKGTALCEGRGEKVVELEALEQRWPLWLVVPPWGVSTPQVYRQYDPRLACVKGSKSLLKLFATGQFAWVNDLEKPALEVEPRLAHFKKKLLDQGLDQIYLTGSGSGLMICSEKRPELDEGVFCEPLHFLRRSFNRWYEPSSTS